MASLPLPDDPTLGPLAELLEREGLTAEVWDAQWRLVYLTSDYLLSSGASVASAIESLGLPAYGEAAAVLRASWPASATQASWEDVIRRLLPAIAHDLPGGAEAMRPVLTPALGRDLDGVTARPAAPFFVEHGEIKFGRRATPFISLCIRITDPAGDFAGTVSIVMPSLSGSTLSLLGTGDHRSLERLVGLARPERRPGAVLFVDLEASTPLSRRLSSPAYFQLVRRLLTCIDDEIVDRGGLVGKHVGDGATGFFLAEQLGGESPAARACLETARAIRDSTLGIAARSNLEPAEVVVRFGLHWGASLYVGRLLTSGRAEVTALGDEVNEAARIEACATGGRALASKPLIEQLVPDDAAALGIDPVSLRFTALADIDDAPAKARRDAPALAVCDV